MNPTESEALSTKMMVTWSRMTIPPSVWEEVFADLDAGTAGTTWVRLSRENVHPPTVAEFIAVYRSLPTAHNQPIRTLCSECGGDGFITGHDYANGMVYPAFYACRCANGENARRQLNEAEAHNRQQREHLFPFKYPPVHHLPGQAS